MNKRTAAIARHVFAPIAAAVAAISVQAFTERRSAARARIARDLAVAQQAIAERDAFTARAKPSHEVAEALLEAGERIGWEKCRATARRLGFVPAAREPRVFPCEPVKGSEAS